jgi:Holliday junction resolvasome RuvABC endonuclease subunit
MEIIALDLSLTSTGVAYGDSNDVGQVSTQTLANQRCVGIRRLSWLVDEIEKIVDIQESKFAVIEGYAMGAQSARSRVFDIGELGGAVKVMLHRYKIPIMIVPPTSLKMYVTGNGRAEKTELKAVLKKWFRKKYATLDEVDAFGLFLLAAYREKVFGGARQFAGFDAEYENAKRKALAGCNTYF